MQKTIKRLSIWAVLVIAILMIPYFGKAPWTAGDYIFAGVVLFGSATAYELATKNVKNNSHRLVVGAGIGAVVIAIWAWAVAGP